MKRIFFGLVAVVTMSASVPVFAADQAKDECLLISKNCLNEVDSLQQKIQKLNLAINKGTKVYTADEIKKLEYKLNELETVMEQLETN